MVVVVVVGSVVSGVVSVVVVVVAVVSLFIVGMRRSMICSYDYGEGCNRDYAWPWSYDHIIDLRLPTIPRRSTSGFFTDQARS